MEVVIIEVRSKPNNNHLLQDSGRKRQTGSRYVLKEVSRVHIMEWNGKAYFRSRKNILLFQWIGVKSMEIQGKSTDDVRGRARCQQMVMAV